MNKKDYIILLISIIILSPIIFYPISTDLATFYFGGKTIIDGGNLYCDFTDIKPPGIYLFFAVINYICGSSEVLIRFIDFIIQSVSVMFLFLSLKKIINNKIIIYSSILIYSLVYVCFNSEQSFQCESIFLCVFSIILYLKFNTSENKYIRLLEGILIGFVTSLKYTFLILGLILFLSDLSEFGLKKSLKLNLMNFIGFIISIGAVSFILFDSRVLSGFLDSMEYLYLYNTSNSFSNSNIIGSVKRISDYFCDYYSILFYFFSFTGLIVLLKSQTSRKFRIFILLSMIFLWFSIGYEQKFLTYHFMRATIPEIILAGFGFNYIYNSIKENYYKLNLKWILILFIIPILIFSPFPRFLTRVTSSVYFFIDKNKYNEYYERGNESVLTHRIIHKEIADYIKLNAKFTEKIDIISTGQVALAFFLQDFRLSKFPHSCFYFSSFGSDKWKTEASSELYNSDWAIVATRDYHPLINNHDLTSYESLKLDSNMNRILIENFGLVFKNDYFLIFKRK